MESGEASAARREPPAEIGPLAVIVFEVATARRVGAQLRYGGGPHLDEIRYAVYRLTLAAGSEDPPDDLTQSRA
ncbi:hypothetical protein OOJ91_33650 [Micromonospora lupini]|uniref:hypothetical protein n=1 Tax=Micromonospora lupini TaxID=285679 RepID=UPI002252386F|nr:hypothetical protein [Micromonospora lupini]MCX5070792.1 hypothetical protein [Micromonospora lupini]